MQRQRHRTGRRIVGPSSVSPTGGTASPREFYLSPSSEEGATLPLGGHSVTAWEGCDDWAEDAPRTAAQKVRAPSGIFEQAICNFDYCGRIDLDTWTKS